MDDFLSYLNLIKWGILASLFFSLAAGCTAPFVLLNRNALLPHALTHIILLPILFISIFWPNLSEILLVSVAVSLTLLLAYFIWFLQKRLSIFEDSASAIVIHLSLALALILAVKGSQYDYRLLNLLFGDLLLASEETFLLTFLVFILTVIFFLRFPWEALLSALGWEIPGINLGMVNLFILFFLCLQVILGVKVLGVLLVSAFYNFSGVVAIKVASSYKGVFLISPGLNLLAIMGGALLSYLFDIPFSAGAIIFMSLYFLPFIFRRT